MQPNFQRIFRVPAPFTRFKRSLRKSDTAADRLRKLLACYKQDDAETEAEDDAADDVRRTVTRDDLDEAIGDVTGSNGDDGLWAELTNL